MGTILIISPENDFHAVVVQERLRSMGKKCKIWNPTFFPWVSSISWNPENYPKVLFKKDEIDFADISVIWWRRYKRPTLNPSLSDQTVKRFCRGEAEAFMEGFFKTLDIPIINNPQHERHASSKLLQLKIAKSLGFKIPATLITNSQQEILSFLEKFNECIIKSLLNKYVHGIITRKCSKDDFQIADETQLCPIIVQELIPALSDIRVTIVNNQVYAAELNREDINIMIDWRTTPLGWKKHNLPTQFQKLLLKFMEYFSLKVGSFDFRLMPNGEYCFLEINPTGQWLFLEIDAGLPISESIASYLCKTVSKS